MSGAPSYGPHPLRLPAKERHGPRERRSTEANSKTRSRRKKRAHRRAIERRCEEFISSAPDGPESGDVPLLGGNGPPRPDGAFYMLFCDACAWDMVGVEPKTSAYDAKCGHTVAHAGLDACAVCAIRDGTCRKCGKARRTDANRFRARPSTALRHTACGTTFRYR